MYWFLRNLFTQKDYADKRLRPLLRRALIILRPALVAIRARKPWVRLRRRLLGWNVLFIVLSVLDFVGTKRQPKLVKSGAEYCEKALHVKLLDDFGLGKNICPRVWITFSSKGRLGALFTPQLLVPILANFGHLRPR